MNKSLVYIVIVTYNAKLWLQKCIENCKDYSIIVVDNASSDDTVSILKENYPDVELFLQKENLGFGAANNIGMSYAMNKGADYVFLMNQDAYLQNDTIERLIAVQKKYPEFGILSPLHFNGQGDGFDRKFSYFMAYDRNKNFYFDALTNKMEDVYSVPFVNAAAWLLPKSTIEKVGGFDPIFFHYGEDDNYCQRVVYNKLKIGVVPSARILHDRLPTYSQPKLFSKAYFLDKENNYKRVMADINIDDEAIFAIYRTYRNSIYKHILIGVIKMKIKTILGFVKELKLLKRAFKESKRSREINTNHTCNL